MVSVDDDDDNDDHDNFNDCSHLGETGKRKKYLAGGRREPSVVSVDGYYD